LKWFLGELLGEELADDADDSDLLPIFSENFGFNISNIECEESFDEIEESDPLDPLADRLTPLYIFRTSRNNEECVLSNLLRTTAVVIQTEYDDF